VSLLHPKWLALHVFTIAVVVGMILMGRWQWHVAIRHGGDLRNYAYALQWWAFTVFAFGMWWRIVNDAFGKSPEVPVPDEPIRPTDYVGYQPPTAAAADDDPERVAYNAYLARLNEQQEDVQ